MGKGEPEQTEKGFGTGLRAHIRREEEPPAQAPPRAPARSDTAELEARTRELVAATEALEEREWRLSAAQSDLAAEAKRLAAREAELDELLARLPGKPVPTILRERVEQHVERLWQSLSAALDATRPDGSADFATRVSAARALLAAAYPDARTAGPAPAPGDDELARLRSLRAEPGAR